MKRRPLGGTGLEIGALGLGCMRLSIAHRPPRRCAVTVIHAALDLGMTLFDTADSYALDDRERGHNERLLAEALAGRRDAAVVATKGGFIRPEGRWLVDARPERLRAACEASLRALATDRIDLYQLHAPDPAVPFADSVGALEELRRAGKVRFVGLSNVDVAQIEAACRITEVVAVQNELSLLARGDEHVRVADACARRGIAFLASRPLGGRQGAGRLAELAPLRDVAARKGVRAARVALAWLLARFPHAVPLVGATRRETLADSAAAAELVLGEEELAGLEA